MTLKISNFTRYPMTRDDARSILSSLAARPEKVDFSEIRSISHCFAHEFVSSFSETQPQILNACPFVERILSSVMP